MLRTCGTEEAHRRGRRRAGGPRLCDDGGASADTQSRCSMQPRRSAGQFNLAKRIPGKDEFDETLRYYRRMIERPA